MSVGIERIGIDIGWRLKLEEAIEWASARDVRYIDLTFDGDEDLLRGQTPRLAAARSQLEKSGIHLGLHTNSNVNVAETGLYVAEAVDEYLKAYVCAAKEVGAGWIVVHGGYHFTRGKPERMQASVERLQRISQIAERAGMLLLLENPTPEPDDAELHYMPHDLEACDYFFSRLTSPALQWTFTVNHAHILPIGIPGFLAEMDLSRCREVRIADCRGTIEEHLPIGEGTIDFGQMFSLIEGAGYQGHYMLAYGSVEDMETGRRQLVEIAAAAS